MEVIDMVLCGVNKVMTNGRFVSVRHRAMTNSYKCRMSVAYFGAPPLHATIVAPSVMVTPQRPSLFRPFTWAEYKKATYSLRLGDTRIQLFTNKLNHSWPRKTLLSTNTNMSSILLSCFRLLPFQGAMLA